MSVRGERNSLRFICIASLLIHLSVARSQEEKSSSLPSLKPFYAEIKGLVKHYYPSASSHIVDSNIQFEYNTRIFIVHEPLKTGEWQDPREQRGPNKGGILCDMNLIRGPYMGAAMVPQTFDKRYFQVLILAPYSNLYDCHLWVAIRYPRDVSNEFLEKFQQLVLDFEKHVKP